MSRHISVWGYLEDTDTSSVTKDYVDYKDDIVLTECKSYVNNHPFPEINNHLNMRENKITNLANPTNDHDAVTKSYVDLTKSYIDFRDNAILEECKNLKDVKGSLNMHENKIINLGSPSLNNDAATKEYVDARNIAVLNECNANIKKEIHAKGEIEPIINYQDATTKSYVDSRDNYVLNECKAHAQKLVENFLPSHKDKLIQMQSFVLRNVGQPEEENDAVTKKYVDNKVSLAPQDLNLLIRETLKTMFFKSTSGLIPPLTNLSNKNGFQVSASTHLTEKVGSSNPLPNLHYAWHAFSNNSKEWLSKDEFKDLWIRIELPVPTRIWAFQLRGKHTDKERPFIWDLQGFNIGEPNWVKLYKTSGTYIGKDLQRFELSKISDAYSFYRLYIYEGEETEEETVVIFPGGEKKKVKITNCGISHMQLFPAYQIE